MTVNILIPLLHTLYYYPYSDLMKISNNMGEFNSSLLNYKKDKYIRAEKIKPYF